MDITIWSDFACPFCYIGEKHLEQAVKELGITDVHIDYMAYELDTDMPKNLVETSVDHFSRALRLTADQAAAQVEKIARFGRQAGIDFRYADSKYCNTFDAHRLVKYANATDKAKVGRLVESLFAAFFTDGLVLSDHEVLVKIASEAGFDTEEVRAVLASDKFADDVRTDERNADLQGVGSVPYMILEGEVVLKGAVPVEDFKNALLQAASVRKQTPETGTADGHVCGPDGCRL